MRPSKAIALDGKTIRGSRTGDTSARHVLAAAGRATGVVPASTDVNGNTNEITRFAPLLDQIPDLHGAAATADALHCQHEHVAYLADCGALFCAAWVFSRWPTPAPPNAFVSELVHLPGGPSCLVAVRLSTVHDGPCEVQHADVPWRTGSTTLRCEKPQPWQAVSML
ncbi:transposase [Streptosporangium sp. CA-115845]|uniref:transposase n=1 Tax=Streptosporangium sp. CA-115845 TaxID=3240071 RepID=UPI003D8DE12D